MNKRQRKKAYKNSGWYVYCKAVYKTDKILSRLAEALTEYIESKNKEADNDR